MNDILNVLIIEDSEDDALLVVRELRRGGFEVVWNRVETSEALIAALSDQLWDVIISDYHLPALDAPKALEIVKQNQLDLPFIVISGMIGELVAVDMMRQGANDYLMKGNLARLTEVVKREIRESQIRSDRRKANIELVQIKERLQIAVESSGLGLLYWSIQTGSATFNDRWAEIIGYSRGELEPISIETWWQNIHPEDLSKIQLALDQQFQQHSEVYEQELRMRHKLGAWVWVLCKGKITEWDEEQNPLRMIFTYLDISGRKQNVEMLLKLNETLESRVQRRAAELQKENTLRQQIMENMAEGLCVCHEIEEFPFLRFTVWNQQMQWITGYTLEEINRLGWEQGLSPSLNSQESSINDLEMAAQGKQLIREEWEIYRQDRQKRTISISRSLLSSSEGQSYLLLLIQDITRRKQAELKLKRQAEQERLLSSIMQRIRLTFNLEEILKATVEEVHQFLQSDRVLVYRVFSEGTGAAIAEAVSPNWSKVLDITFPEEVFPEQNYARYVQGRIYTLSDREDPQQDILPCLVEFLATIQVRAKVVVPIVQDQTLWGLLIVHQCDRPRQWQNWEINLLKQVANQLAIAIQQSNLYYQLQKELQEREYVEEVIRHQAQQEVLLREITQRIRQSLDLQTIFETAVQEVRHFLSADRVGIFKFHPESNFDDGEFVAESVVAGFTSALAIRVHDHTFGDNYASLYANGRCYVVNDIYQGGDSVCHTDILAQFQVQANLVVPLLCGNDLWGLLCIHQCASTRCWKQDEVDFCQQIANQLAIAIQQVSLFGQLQQELHERQQTEAKLTESNQKLAISNEELIRATRLKDEFLANMSHELRTPLNSILGMTEALQEQIFGTVNEAQIKALQTVERSGNHLLALINDILDVAKIESGQVTLELTSSSIKNLCQSSITFIKQQALQKRVQLIEQIPTNLPELMLDERRIRQVLINLLNNAVKFTPEGGSIMLEVSLITSEPDTPHYLRIAIKDTGIGISATDIPKLFQPFIQIDSTLNRQYVGTGLGLALVKRIVEMHGGKVGLTSEVGIGSCFMVDLPYDHSALSSLASAADPDTNTQQTSPPKQLEQLEQLRQPLILLADDNEANVITVACYLEAKGYRLVIAKNGVEAIALTKSHQPDLILMDIQMPIIDGLEAITQIRLDPQLVNIPIIAMTALAMLGDREQCLGAGANNYLTKPVKLKQLVITIEQLLVKNQNQK